jgi:oligopeptidase B
MPAFPAAPKRPHKIIQHGETRIDNYYWLRHREDPEVLKFLHAQTEYLEEAMEHTKPLQAALFSEMKGRVQETDLTVPEKRGGYLYYERTEAGKQYPIYCRREDTPNSPEEILLDQNELALGKTFCSVSGFAISPDENKLAYSVDVDGDEVYTIFIKYLKTGALYPETIQNTYGSVYSYSGVEWANDNQTIFYITLDEANRSNSSSTPRISRTRSSSSSKCAEPTQTCDCCSSTTTIPSPGIWRTTWSSSAPRSTSCSTIV